ncbi:MAG: 16S rRNA (cytidine(1402)-2'-O)-methyltransferase [Geobacter sp.]|nr:16S rRNA (cytidine(1402)-2'-O)-methyltransferase [Geobacter sp.]
MPAGTLYIVATPIGNLEDMTFRGVRTLKEVDLIAAEDTRHSRKLLSHFGIATRMTPYHDHNEQLKTDYLIELLQSGQNIAIITDAGTPCIADPGYRVVQAAGAAGIRVVPIPGASAIAAAVSASGLPSDRFVFEGFLPPKQGKRMARLAELKTEPRMGIFYEAPHRLAATLADMLTALHNRRAVVARELTKIHEEFRRGTLEELAEYYREQQVKGEIVIMVSPPKEEADTADSIDATQLLSTLLVGDNLSLKDAVKQASLQTGISRSTLYDMALQVRQQIANNS